MPRVCVVTALYNAAATIRQTLQSLAAQTHTDWRCIVVNDGSTDGGPALAELIGAADRRISVVHQPNLGIVGARNHALRLADGDYLMLLDSDDWLAPDAMERLLATAASTHGGGAFGAFNTVDETGRLLATHRPRERVIGFSELLSGVFLVPHCHLVPLKEAVAVGFDPGQPLVEDTDYALRLALRGMTWTAAPGDAVAFYRLSRNSMSRDLEGMLRYSLRAFRRAFEAGRADPRWRQVDCSPQRLRHLECDQALTWSTRRALREDEHAVEAALAMYRAVEGLPPPSASGLVRAVIASHHIEFVRPGRLSAAERDLCRRRVRAWFEGLSRVGMASQGCIRRASVRVGWRIGGVRGLLGV